MSANLPTDYIKLALSTHLMVVTCSDVFSTIIMKIFAAKFVTLATIAIPGVPLWKIHLTYLISADQETCIRIMISLYLNMFFPTITFVLRSRIT